MSNQCLQTLHSQQLRSFQMIFQWISCLINAAAGWYRHSYQHQTAEQMLSVLTWYMPNQNWSWNNYTHINTNKSCTRSIQTNGHIDASAQVKFNLISFQKFPLLFESRLKADGERIYHFLITQMCLSQGEGWDLFIYALIHSALSDSRATYGLFWTLLAVRQEYCNNLCPLFCNNCLAFAPPGKTWIYKLRVTFQLVFFNPQGSSQPWLKLTQEMHKHRDTKKHL